VFFFFNGLVFIIDNSFFSFFFACRIRMLSRSFLRVWRGYVLAFFY